LSFSTMKKQFFFLKKKKPHVNSATPHEALHCSQMDENSI
jgi:hypothetical protein